MKKLLTLPAVILFYVFSIQAQGIQFEKISYAEALEKSKKENKLVFIDFHTVWCGPCRMMEKEIFPLEKVGNVYNANFINLEIDGEKGEGVELVKKYDIKNYPTFLFLDSNGKVLYQFMGARDESAFIEEVKRVEIGKKYGGWKSFMDAYKSENPSSETVWDYYQLAREEEKPEVLNTYLKSLPDDKLFHMSTGRFLESLTEFDFDLNQRLVDGLVARDDTNPEYIFRYTFRVQRNISKKFDEAIENGDKALLNKLLGLKKAFAPISDRNETDINLRNGRGLLFASPNFIALTYDATNQENFETFKPLLESYMDNLMTKAAPVDSTTLWKKGSLEMLEQNTDYPQFLFYPLSRNFEYMAQHILLWTDFYWRNSPSTSEVRSRCAEWVNYAFKINPYSIKTPIPAARLMVRLGYKKEAFDILDKAASIQKKYNSKDQRLIKNIEILRRDIQNNK